VGLVLGAFIAMAFTLLLYIPRRVVTFKQFADSFAEGFKAMVPAILILTFAWTLSGVTSQMGATVFVAEFVRSSAGSLANFLPAIVFVIAIGLAFATGTSWGTFGVLLPIVCAVFPSGELMVIAVSACLAGAVCGDHCSPISDTTIMASTGGQCDHINHVSTQLPYALLVAGVSFVGYILAGLIQNAWIVLPISLALLVGVLFIIKIVQSKKV
jgi:Na+/H+ antiporter NhaC